MKFLRSIVLLTVSALTVVACQKTHPEQGVKVPMSETGKLISAVKLSSRPAPNMIGKAIERAASTGILSSMGMMTSILAGSMFDIDINDSNYTLDIYRIKYTSIGGPSDAFGNFQKTEVYADIGFIRDANQAEMRQLESVSLFHSLFNTAENTETYYEELIMPTRAAFNALVVFPLYQGVCGNPYTINPSEAMMKARQAIDAERAALEFIRQQNDVEMLPTYYTENIAMSNGCGAAIAVPFLLESTFREINNSDIRLKSTFCAEGCYAYSAVLDDFLEESVTPDFTTIIPNFNIGFLKTVGFTGAVIGAYDTWKEKYFKDIRVEDFFSEDFLNTEITEGLNPIQAYRAGLYDYLSVGTIRTFQEIKDIVNPAIITSDNRFDLEAPCIKALLNCFSENEKMLNSQWRPSTKIRIAHSNADEFIKYSVIRKMYGNLSQTGTNPNVSFEETGYFGHLAGTFYFTFKDVMFKKHPVPLDK